MGHRLPESSDIYAGEAGRPGTAVGMSFRERCTDIMGMFDETRMGSIGQLQSVGLLMDVISMLEHTDIRDLECHTGTV